MRVNYGLKQQVVVFKQESRGTGRLLFNLIAGVLIFSTALLLVIPLSKAHADSAQSITWTTTDDFKTNAVVGPDLIPNTSDDAETTGAATTTNNIDLTGNQVSISQIAPVGGELATGGSGAHSIFIKTDGTLWGWGYNYYGALGLGSTQYFASPTQIGSDNHWQSVASGGSEGYYDFSLAIKTDGTLWATGYNGEYNLGLGDNSNRTTFTQVGTDTNWASVTAGGYGALAIKTDGTLWGWGYNNAGELGFGNGAATYIHQPTKIGTDTNWAEVSQSPYDEFTLALKTTGTLWATGYNGYYNLGLGDMTERTQFTQVGTDTNWTSISAGGFFSLAIKSTGTLWAWGYGEDGELGSGGSASEHVPTQVGTDTDWASAAAGGYYGSDFALAIKTDGTLWSWGYDDGYGNLGLGDGEDIVYTPTQVGSDTNWAEAATGYLSSLAVKTDGTLWGWGDNDYWQLTSALDGYVYEPTQIGSGTNWALPTNDQPVQYNASGTLSGLELDAGNGKQGDWQSLSWVSESLPADTTISFQARTSNDRSTWSAWSSSFTQSTAASTAGSADLTSLPTTQYIQFQITLTTSDASVTPTLDSFTLDYNSISSVPNGSSITWTSNDDFNNNAVVGPDLIFNTADDGQLGNATTENQIHVKQGLVYLDYTAAFSSASVGNIDSFEIKPDGTLWDEGANGANELGLGDTTNRDAPTQVGTDSNWKMVSTSLELTGSTYALKTDGTLWDWGVNSSGELGLGDTTNRDAPTQVGADTNWASVTAGGYNALAIKSDGTLWGWGSNAQGQLGLGDTSEREVPTQIGSDTDWSVISGGDNFFLAIKTDGTLWASGYNSFGQLGQGDTSQRTSFTQVGTDTDWASITAGEDFALALKSDGTLWGWGENGLGNLGVGDTADRHVPTQVGTDTDWSMVSGNSFGTTLALKSNGTLWAWGENSSGQLGLGDTTNRDAPTQVGTDTNWSNISAGWAASLAIKSDGTTWGFGDNTAGELGLGDTDQHLVPTELDPDETSFDNFWGNYLSSGTLSGFTVNAGSGSVSDWTTLSWVSEALPANTAIKFRVRTSNDNITYSSWSDYFVQNAPSSESGSADISTITPAQYMQIEITLTSTDSRESPFLDSFTLSSTVDHAPNSPSSLGPVNYVNGSTTISTQPELTFALSDPDSGDQVQYRIQISRAADFSIPVITYTSALGAQGPASFTVGQDEELGEYTAGIPGQTLGSGTYYWQVRAIDATGLPSDYAVANSDAAAFTVQIGTPSPPINVGPVNVGSAPGSGGDTPKSSEPTPPAVTTNDNPAPPIETDTNNPQLPVNPTQDPGNSGSTPPSPAAPAQSISPAAPAQFQFTKDLSYGEKSEDVARLQQFLKDQGKAIYPEGLVTGFFGPLTKQGVTHFQELYSDEILKPLGLKNGTGFFGYATRVKANKLLDN